MTKTIAMAKIRLHLFCGLNENVEIKMRTDISTDTNNQTTKPKYRNNVITKDRACAQASAAHTKMKDKMLRKDSEGQFERMNSRHKIFVFGLVEFALCIF